MKGSVIHNWIEEKRESMWERKLVNSGRGELLKRWAGWLMLSFLSVEIFKWIGEKSFPLFRKKKPLLRKSDERASEYLSQNQKRVFLPLSIFLGKGEKGLIFVRTREEKTVPSKTDNPSIPVKRKEEKRLIHSPGKKRKIKSHNAI